MALRNKSLLPINSGSVADIAFLLLIFFLVSTTIDQDKGLILRLPPVQDEPQQAEINERNIFTISINANDQFLINGEIRTHLDGLASEVELFILNDGRDPGLSDTPEKAVVSIKTSRGTRYASFVQVLDEVKGVYYQIYADRVGLTVPAFRSLDTSDPTQSSLQPRPPRNPLEYFYRRAGVEDTAILRCLHGSLMKERLVL
jgi:biopolymer transport protein ExbD